MKKKPLIFVGILVVVVLLAVFKGMVGGKEGKIVTVQPLSEQTIQASILASGSLKHEDEVLLTSEEIGKVVELNVEEGDRVKKGQLILRIDDEERLTMVEQSEAAVRMQEIAIERRHLDVENLERQWQRKKQLFEKKLLDQDSYEASTLQLSVAKVDLESAREQLTQQKAQLEQQRNRLEKTRVYSPIDGVVTSLDIEVGETAITGTTNIAGSSLMTIANPESIQTEVYVDESDVANVKVGQEASVVAAAYPDNPVKGIVDSIAVSAKQQPGKQGLSFAVKIKLYPTEEVELRPGMSCRAEIFTHGTQRVPAVPIQAILVDEDLNSDNTHYYVFINDHGVAKKRDVEVGLSDDAHQVISSGVEIGEQIVVGPDSVLRHLEDGDKLKIKAS